MDERNILIVFLPLIKYIGFLVDNFELHVFEYNTVLDVYLSTATQWCIGQRSS